MKNLAEFKCLRYAGAIAAAIHCYLAAGPGPFMDLAYADSPVTAQGNGSNTPLASLKSESDPLLDPLTNELNVDLLNQLVLISEPYKFNMANYIPLKGLPQNDDGRIVALRIGRHIMQNHLDMYQEHAPLVATAADVNRNMKAQLGGEKHALVFRLRPIETLAEITYKGALAVDSKLSYEIDRREIMLGVRWGF